MIQLVAEIRQVPDIDQPDIFDYIVEAIETPITYLLNTSIKIYNFISTFF